MAVAEKPRITAHRTCPGRYVFTEVGNTEGWIATDTLLDPTSDQ